MTATAVCRWCGEPFIPPHQRGPTPMYCRASHRQRAYEQRREANNVLDATTLEEGYWCMHEGAYFDHDEADHYDYPCGWTDRGGTFHGHVMVPVSVMRIGEMPE